MGATGAIAAGVMSFAASDSASRRQAGAAGDAAQVQWDIYNQTRKDLTPYRETGTSSLAELRHMMEMGGVASDADTSSIDRQIADLEEEQSLLLGRPTTSLPYYGSSGGVQFGANQADRQAGGAPPPRRDENRLAAVRDQISALQSQRQNMLAAVTRAPTEPYNFTKTPDYQFRFDETMKGLNNQLGAGGMRLSGRALKEAMRYGGNLASAEYGNRFNRLAALAGIGQASTHTGAQLGANTASNVGNALMQAGNAQAAGIVGGANALNQGIGNALYYYNRTQQPTGGTGYTGGGSGWGASLPTADSFSGMRY